MIYIDKEILDSYMSQIYGGYINVIGKITKDCSMPEDSFSLYNDEMGKALNNVKETMYKMYLQNYS